MGDRSKIMNKVRTFLLGVALALPLAALGSAGDVAAMGVSAAKPSSSTSVVSGPSSQGTARCCVMFMGTWFCFPCTGG